MVTPARTPRLPWTLVGGGIAVLALLGYAGGAGAETVVDQDTVSITALVPGEGPPPANPVVEFHGLSAASAAVTITRGGSAVTTQTASTSGAFNVALTDQPVGQQSYTVSAVDTAGGALTPVTFALNLTMGSTTIITGVFLGPSIAVDKASVKLGGFVTVAGHTTPASTVTLTVQSDPVSYSVTSAADGFWSKLVNSLDIGVGTHSAQAQTVSGNQVSSVSSTVTFAVNPLEQCDGKKTADLNCDARVDLVDFSILLYFWLETTPSNSRADINANGRVDVVDFSIMLYQWTG